MELCEDEQGLDFHEATTHPQYCMFGNMTNTKWKDFHWMTEYIHTNNILLDNKIR